MSTILYYSQHCNHCKRLLQKLSRSTSSKDIHFICIDERAPGKDGTTMLALDDGQQVILPPNVKTVPTLLLLHHGNRALEGYSDIQNYLAPREAELTTEATKGNEEPAAYSMYEMGGQLSDVYSYLDMSADELSAKGNGGLRQMHRYMALGASQSIATPPDNYTADKVGTVDIGKMTMAREADIKKQKR
jgi:hypothetical protein